MRGAVVITFLAAGAHGFAAPGMGRMAPRCARASPHMKTLAEEMFGDVFKGIKGLADQAAALAGGDSAEEEVTPETRGNAVASDLDRRAQSGELNFNDFLTIGSAFAGLGDTKVAGVLPGKLTPAELADARQKLVMHQRIVEVMLDEEREQPELLLDEVKSGNATPGPRLQRLAKAADVKETDVALFAMQVRDADGRSRAPPRRSRIREPPPSPRARRPRRPPPFPLSSRRCASRRVASRRARTRTRSTRR